jgi:hypothetical protein
VLLHGGVVFGVQDQEGLQRALDFDSQLDSVVDEVAPDLHEALVLSHVVAVLQVVGVHLRDPLDESDVV